MWTTVAGRQPSSLVVPHRPRPSPTVDHSSRHKPAVFMHSLHISVSHCRLVVLTQDGRLYILQTRKAYFLPSRPVPGSWQSVLRALSGPWPVGNTDASKRKTTVTKKTPAPVIASTHPSPSFRCYSNPGHIFRDLSNDIQISCAY